jgi:hypothetical protein
MGIRQHGWKPGLSHIPAIVQITASSVKFCLLFNEINRYRSFWHETILKRFIVFVLPECVGILLETSVSTFMFFGFSLYFIAGIA